MSQVLPFGDVLEAADQLTPEEQQQLVHILNRRLALAARQQLASEIQESRQEFAQGRCTPTTAENLMQEIMK